MKAGSGARLLPPLPEDPVDPVDPRMSSRPRFLTTLPLISANLLAETPPETPPGGSGAMGEPWEALGRIWEGLGSLWDGLLKKKGSLFGPKKPPEAAWAPRTWLLKTKG